VWAQVGEHDGRRALKTWLLGSALAAVAVVTGCSSMADDDQASSASRLGAEPTPEEIAELDKVLGNDRVGKAFHANVASISSQLADNEKLLGIGRACNRPTSHEIFIVEEKSTRFGGKQQDTLDLLPRAVIGGCNQNPTVSPRQSFELFAAAISDKSYPLNDPFSTEPVELMALDGTTGLYNFYIIERPEPGYPQDRPTVTRFARRPDGQIERRQKLAARPATIEISSNRKCFDCHVHGGPVMNELTQPWTGWVSSNGIYSRPTLTGTSRELVSESRPFGTEHTRASLANDLEKITRAAIATWVEGLPESPGSGLGPQTLSGAQPGGVPALLKSVFCQTEVNFASAFDTVPFQLFVDEQAAAIASLERPLSLVSTKFPVLLPVRSETDKRIEVFLQKKRILLPDTVLAARLVDDQNDVFSSKRCDLHAKVVAAMTGGATPNDAARTVIGSTLATRNPSAREKYIAVLLDPATADDVRAKAEAAYVADITARYQADTAKLETPDGFAELDQRLAARQRATSILFPTTANPLPRMQHVPSIFVPAGTEGKR
jgi:hypothetical protein